MAATAAAVAGVGGSRLAHAEPAALLASNPTGTTLDVVSTPGIAQAGGYRPLVAGSGWPLYIRQELATAGPAREMARTALTAFIQVTDLHLTDAQSPARFEFVHPFVSSAYRPHETLTTQGAVSLVKQLNALPGGPFTGRPFDCLVSTGDNTDNKELIELDWFLTVMSGGSIIPNTGAPDRYEGVQAHGSSDYWLAESPYWDSYKGKGFQQIPGFLSAAISGHVSPGLRMPWYSVVGNHDEQLLGTVPNGLLEWMYTSPIKFDLPHSDPSAIAIAKALCADPSQLVPILLQLKSGGPFLPATVDQRRLPFTLSQYVRRHFEPAITGPGPVGHGFTDPDGPTWYTFQVAPGVLGVAMNTTNDLGLSAGSINESQLRFVLEQIDAHPDQLVILFSHHTSRTMNIGLPDPNHPGEKLYTGTSLVAALLERPNVIAWVNGHTHTNEMIPHKGATPKQSFWEINTASHIDYPQLARIIEVTDNHDGTLSLFTPLVEAQAPFTADSSDLSPTGLASLYRELSYNDLHRKDARLGAVADRNCELLLAHPLH